MTRSWIGFAALVLAGCCCADGDEGTIVHAQSESRGWSYGEGRVEPAVSPLELEAERHGELVVAPDRALVTIEARIDHDDRAAATARIREIATALDEASTEDCEMRIWALAPAVQESDRFVAAATLALDVDLRGDETPLARHEHLERCVQQIHDLPHDEYQGVELRVSEPLVTLDDPGAHRDALLARRFAPLHAIAVRTGAPPQFRADGLRCTAGGEVTIAHRSLHGVRLAIDLACARDVEPAASATADVR